MNSLGLATVFLMLAAPLIIAFWPGSSVERSIKTFLVITCIVSAAILGYWAMTARTPSDSDVPVAQAAPPKMETEEQKNIREYGFKPKGQTIAWNQAKDHIGERVTIEGKVVELAWHAFNDDARITYLNMGQAYSKKSKNRFQAIIWDQDVQSGNVDEDLTLGLEGVTIQVTGVVEDYRGVPEIVIRESSQVRVADEAHNWGD